MNTLAYIMRKRVQETPEMFTLRVAVVLALVGIAGCGDASSDISSSTDAIESGKRDPNDPAVGMVMVATAGVCSGTLIAPNVVLTAAHCLGQEGIDTNTDAFYTGAGAPNTDPQPVVTGGGFVKHAIRQAETFPGYFPDGCPNGKLDIALIRLAQPITNTSLMKFSTNTKPLPAGNICKTVGYGTHDTANGGEFLEQKWSAREDIVSYTTTAILVRFDTGLAAEGDSGGPLICNDEIVGTTSCSSDPAGTAPKKDHLYYARVDGAASWIAKTIAAWR